jgi:hypothetical protein
MGEFNRTIETFSAQGKPRTIQTKKCTNPSDDMKRKNEMLTKSGCKFSPVTEPGTPAAIPSCD